MSVVAGEILITDATPATREQAERYLTERGYKVTSAATPDECIRSMATCNPSLVILRADDPFPGLGDFLRRIKAQDPQPYVLLLAAIEDPGVITAALRGGADDHLATPIKDPELLLCAVERSLAMRQRLDEMQRIEAELKEKNRILTDNLRSLERDQQTGLQVQRSMMPDSPFVVGDITFAHHVIPSLILSGDFIDYFELPDGRILFYIADVSGHGSSSAFVTVLLKNLSRRLARDFAQLQLASTAEVLAWLNGEIVESALDKHVTMFLGILDQAGQSLEYSNAAHFPGAILSFCDQARFLEVGGLPLGLYDRVDYEVRSVKLPVKYTIVMFSDGVFEVMKQETLRAKERYLLDLVASGLTRIDALVEELGLNRVAEVPDDVALFTVTGNAQ